MDISNKPPKCSQCKNKIKDKDFQTHGIYNIHNSCMGDFIEKHLKKTVKKKVKKEKDWKKSVEKMKKKSKLDLTQTVFNKYIRLRDKDLPCVSSGRKIEYGKDNYSAGHYYSRGARSDLRFNEDNVFGQSNKDNVFPGTDTMANFKKEVIKRIGKKRFEALSVRKKQDYSEQTLKEMRSYYSAKIKQLEYDKKNMSKFKVIGTAFGCQVLVKKYIKYIDIHSMKEEKTNKIINLKK